MTGPIAAGEYFGFQIINILNLKDNTKCSGVLLNTDRGCHAVTSAHCVRGLAINEENLIISTAVDPQIESEIGRDIYSKIIFSPSTDHRSHLIKAKPSSDLAQIYFDQGWAQSFCQDENKLTAQNTQRNLHIDEVYTQGEQNAPGPVNQQIPGSMGQMHGPNPTIYYRPSQNYLLAAAGFQNDLATLLSVSSIDFDSFNDLERKMKSRLNVEYSSLPGFEFAYQVKGINLSQGMSGGALIEIVENELKFKGLSASFYPFQWMSNFVPSSYIMDFLANYHDDLSDQYEVSIDNKAQTASDQVSKKEEDKILQLKEEGQIPTVVVVRKPTYDLKPQNGPIRVPRSQVRFGDTDQDDVGGDVTLSCDWAKSNIDPFFDILPPVSNCFDLSQTRFQHSGVMAKELENKIIIAYQDEPINGLADLRAIQNHPDYDANKLITRAVGGYPKLSLRKSILEHFKGFYFEEENHSITNQMMFQYAYLGEGFTRQYTISPSSNSLIRESVINNTALYGELFENIFNYSITNNLERSDNIKLKINVASNAIKLGLKLTNGENYYLIMTPSFDHDYKTLLLKTSVTRYDSNFTYISDEKFELRCDNRSFLKLICFNEKMEFGLSTQKKDSAPLVRLAFWDNLKTKRQALETKSLKMNYIFGSLKKRESNHRRVDYASSFDRLKLKKLLKNDENRYRFIEIEQDQILSFIQKIPNQVKSKMRGELTAVSFFERDELLHLVYDSDKKYGVLYDRSFEIIGVILNGRISTDARDIL